MNVLEAVRQLGAAIQADDRYQIYAAARKKNDEDALLQERIGAFNLQRLALDQALSADEKDQKKVDDAHAQLRAIYSEIMSNPSMMAYNAAKSALDVLMNEVNSVLSQVLDGADPATCEPEAIGCTGSCETCGGCH